MVKKKKNGAIISKILVPLTLFLLGLVYIHNLTRDIFGGDVGDLVTAAAVFGVAHPSGYPTFTLLGVLLNQLPFNIPPVTKIGLLSVFASLASLLVYFIFMKKMTKNLTFSMLGMLTLSFSFLFWLYSEIPEVFIPNILFVFLVLYFSYRFFESKKEIYLFITVFLCGLSLTNHHTAVLVFPSVLIMVSRHLKFIFTKRIILFSLLSFIAGLLPYIYVPIAASTRPAINWDSATNIPALIKLFLRFDYGTFSSGNFQKASGIYELFVLSKVYFQHVITSISIPSFLIILLGVYQLFKLNRRLFLAFLCAFFLSGPIFITYAAFPLSNAFIYGISERFYILSSTILMLFFPFGMILIKNTLRRVFSKEILVNIVLLAFWLIPLFLFIRNFEKTDLSHISIGNKLAQDALKFLPRDAVLVVDGDTIVTNVWYIHYVLKVRGDIKVVQKGGYANTYFMDEEEKRYKKENNIKDDDPKLTQNVLKNIAEERDIFFTSPVALDGIVWVPQGLAARYTPKNEIPEEIEYIKKQKVLWKEMKPPKKRELAKAERNLITLFIPIYYASGLVKTGDFIIQNYGNTEEAIYFYKQALDIDPDYSQAYVHLAAVQFDQLGQCREAEINLDRALSINPLPQYFLIKYLNYKNCFKDEDKIKKYREFFRKKFNQDVEQKIKQSTEVLK